MKEKIPIIIIISVLLLITTSLSAMAFSPDVELPPTTNYVTMRATDGTNSWFDMNISDIPAEYDIANGTYLGWCSQKSITMTRGVNHSVRLYSSYDPNMPENYMSENWSKINYILNHKQGNRDSIQEVIWYYISLDSYPLDSDSQTMIADADQNGSDFIPKTGEILAIIVEGVETIQRSFFEYTIPTLPSNEPNEPPSGPTGSTSSSTGGTTVQNHAPTADATAGEPYTGFASGEITFDGSRSYDIDGKIVFWRWNFGDGTTIGSGEIIKHSYADPGNYTASLTVTDNKGATDSYTTTAVITEGNNPPNTPTISGPISGHKNTSYEFTAVSTDPDENDTICYTFNWSDGEIITTAYSSSGTPITQTHSWSVPGHYTITVKASDTQLESGTATRTISVDVIDVEDIGYLIENGDDGEYDFFHSNTTGIETKVERLDSGNYLIDIDGDGTWNYEYSPASGESSIYQEKPIAEYMGVAIVLIVGLILFFVLDRKRKQSRT